MKAVRERIYVEAAMNAAVKTAGEFWDKTLEFPSVEPNPKTAALLNTELPSVRAMYSTVVRFALSGQTNYLEVNGNGSKRICVIIEQGGRNWSQRVLGVCAGMSTNTARKAMKRLEQLGLLIIKRIQGLGTHITVEGFEKHCTQIRRAAVNPSQVIFTVSKADTIPLPTTSFRSITSNVDVTKPELKTKKEGDTFEKEVSRAHLAKWKTEMGWD